MAALDHVDGVDLHIAEMDRRPPPPPPPPPRTVRWYRAAAPAARCGGRRHCSTKGVRRRGALLQQCSEICAAVESRAAEISRA